MPPCINGWFSGAQQLGMLVVKVMAVRNTRPFRFNLNGLVFMLDQSFKSCAFKRWYSRGK